jgi:hypothetical protein
VVLIEDDVAQEEEVIQAGEDDYEAIEEVSARDEPHQEIQLEEPPKEEEDMKELEPPSSVTPQHREPES